MPVADCDGHTTIQGTFVCFPALFVIAFPFVLSAVSPASATSVRQPISSLLVLSSGLRAFCLFNKY